ncbi:glycosyltransferase, CAZy family GT29 [Selaginella moellendorffii]|uniref:Glycosyltransferase, CAZy family GT29 n=1 Tax=Selaginella moellendorffii TaxID=88036 RepID=D8QX38_SELML|nr:glycosyltransferase, CAZy family GT29 [Selaginella moellendorffii]
MLLGTNIGSISSNPLPIVFFWFGFLVPKPWVSLSHEDKSTLKEFHGKFHQCVRTNGIGIYSRSMDYCTANFYFSHDTEAKWTDPKTGNLEPVTYNLDLCEAMRIWEQVRNSSTILTKEYIDGLPNGWHDYAWKRINKGILLRNCEDKKLCLDKLSKVLPDTPPFVPRQFGRCAVVGNSGDLLKAKFGREIDGFDAVVRHNGAPIENYTDYVGSKRSFRLLNRGSAKALDKVAELDGTGKEVLIVKTTIHDVMSKMIKEIPIINPVYLMLGASLSSSAKGTGVKALEFALSVCETVDIYGFTVDPGYVEWSRYFSESRGGHTPLLGRAYYQMMECLGLIRIHSPMRLARGSKSGQVPSKSTLDAARRVSQKIVSFLWSSRRNDAHSDPLSSCSIWKKRSHGHRRVLPASKKAAEHDSVVKSVTQYPLEHGTGMLCVQS